MKTRNKKTRYSGTTMVEAALVFPLLLLLTLGAIEYGWLFLKAQQTTHAAREGARIAIRAGLTDPDVVNNAIDYLMTAAGISGYTTTISELDVAAGEHVTVQITVPCGENIVLIDAPLLLPVPENLGAAVTMAKEGP